MSEQFKTSPENINEIPKNNISQKIEEIWDKSDQNLKNKIKLSYQWLKELTNFIAKTDKLSLQETLEKINISDSDKDELISLSEEWFQSLKKWLFINNSIDLIENNNIWSKNLDYLTKKIFNESRCNNAQFNTAWNLSHHIDGCIIWTANTIIVIWKITIEIILDLVKFPSDLYSLYTGKGKLPTYNI